ncbi:death effector domain-containing protein-like [Ptychodera flava]|uniref:death effector domain-containing protein-like n=1 Tax=Ptychodera flava TaxID=63121 RepID=UPI00396A95A1
MADTGQKGLHSLHDVFRIVADQLTQRDLEIIRSFYPRALSESEKAKILDGFGLFLALEKNGLCDASNFKQILELLRITSRHDLIPYLTLKRRKTVCPDPVDKYLDDTACITKQEDVEPENNVLIQRQKGKCVKGKEKADVAKRIQEPPQKKRRKSTKEVKVQQNEETKEKEKFTCDIRLRVRAEYCHHDNALQGNIFSNKAERIERQFEKFTQASTILKSRDLGSIICDIKFSELTYLDAFWRDYINGSLLEALKGVFITESLKQAVGHEAIKLLVNVDEDDYEAGRLKLLKNLTQ